MTKNEGATELGSQEFWNRLATNPAGLAAEVMSMDLINLQQTLQRQPALRAWVGAQYETARVEEEQADADLKAAKARATLRAKEAKDPTTGKDKTVQVLAAEVETDPAVEAAQAAYFDASRKKGALKAMVDGLEHRKDMLIQISSNQRKESRDYDNR